jgi:hypothetical protein
MLIKMKMSGKNFDKKVIKEKELIISYYIDFAPTSLKTAFLEKKSFGKTYCPMVPMQKIREIMKNYAFCAFRF